MADVSAQPHWRAWQWVAWVSGALLIAIAVGYLSWVLFMAGAACDNDVPAPSSVRELQTILAL